jgi:hypothetical protein
MYTEIRLETPTTQTVAAAATSLFSNRFNKYVFAVVVRVRSMGTATYVRLGTSTAQNYSLTTAGQTWEWWGFPGQVLDLAKVFTSSDTADAVLEIWCVYAPVLGTGEVDLVEGRGK